MRMPISRQQMADRVVPPRDSGGPVSGGDSVTDSYEFRQEVLTKGRLPTPPGS